MKKHKIRQGKKTAIIGGLFDFLAASIKRRELIQLEPSHGTDSRRLSWSEWKTVLAATGEAIGDKNLPTLAAGVAYYSTLAFFPFLAAAVAIAALLISPEQLEALVKSVQLYLPADIAEVIVSQLQNLVSKRADNYLAAAIAIAIALFGASGASKSLVTASNVVHGVKESRGWLTQQAWGIAWTIAGLVFGGVIAALLAVNATMLGYLGMPEWGVSALLYGRWLLMLLVSMGGLAVFYRHGPNRHRLRWRWINWGAAIATLLWLAATALFFVYVQNFANYTQSYSLFAGIIALMIWMNLSALIVLVGAEINHQCEVVSRKK